MTAIAKRKTICRTETAASFQGRALVIELRPYTVLIRQKGLRRGFELDWESVFSLAVKKAVAAEREQRKAKKGRKGS